MKPSLGFSRELATRGSVLMIAGFAIFVLTENACSDSSSSGAQAAVDASTPVTGCFAGETLTQVGKQILCCSGTPPTLVCHDEGARAGDPCSASSFPASEQTVNVTLDVCVSDTCDGNHTPTTYDGKTIATTTPLTCTNGTLVAAGDPTTQEVDRICADVTVLACGSGYGYAYGYGYGGTDITTRAPSVQSSVCSTSNSAPSPCAVGDL